MRETSNQGTLMRLPLRIQCTNLDSLLNDVITYIKTHTFHETKLGQKMFRDKVNFYNSHY
jgi:hypothetical protein